MKIRSPFMSVIQNISSELKSCFLFSYVAFSMNELIIPQEVTTSLELGHSTFILDGATRQWGENTRADKGKKSTRSLEAKVVCRGGETLPRPTLLLGL